MRCPFLREAQVKFCRASAFRKMIVRLPGQPDNERCSSEDYVNCPVVKQHQEDHPSLSHCPFLHESLVQYCSASAVTKYIPYSESALSQCGTESHKYCELFLALAQPGSAEGQSDSAHIGDVSTETIVDGVRVPRGLYFASNHMWLDIGADGTLHVGIDDFVARVFSSIDHLTFITTKGLNNPTVVLTVAGVDVQMVFPNAMVITKPNSYLRTNPSKALTDPYSLGWLFEGVSAKQIQKGDADIRKGLMTGVTAHNWMKIELGRLDKMVHNITERSDFHGVATMADGGTAYSGLLHHLDRGDVLRLCNVFFSSFSHRDGK